MIKAEKYFYSFRVLSQHLDIFNHVNNAVYLQLFEQARWDFIGRNGYGVQDVQKTGKGPIILDLQLRFKREILLGETVTIESICTEFFRGKFFKIEQTMLKSGGAVACQAVFLLGIMDLNSRQIVKCPVEWQKAMGIS